MPITGGAKVIGHLPGREWSAQRSEKIALMSEMESVPFSSPKKIQIICLREG